MTESHNRATGADSNPEAADFINSDIETSVSTAGTDAGQLQPPPDLRGADGPVLDRPATAEELRELAGEFARRREQAGNAEQRPTQFKAPGIGDFKDARSAVERGTETRLAEIYAQERAKGIHPDEALATTRAYLNEQPPRKIDDGKDDTFSSPRQAAERLNQLRQEEAKSALQARAASAHFETRES